VDAAVFEREGVRSVAFLACFADADFLSVHLPLTAETRGMVSRDALAHMKRGAILVNTSRGPVIDETALIDALRTGHLAAAGLDVFATEPLPADHPLLQLTNVTVSGHVGFYSVESIVQMQHDAAEQVAQVLSGSVPRFLANREVLAMTAPAPHPEAGT
jgi:D-3-phosphoglycerate dehydrogenase